jgi:hypothetical protein
MKRQKNFSKENFQSKKVELAFGKTFIPSVWPFKNQFGANVWGKKSYLGQKDIWGRFYESVSGVIYGKNILVSQIPTVELDGWDFSCFF